MRNGSVLGADGDLVLPFYLICDVSSSMRDEMVALNEGVTRLWEAIVSQPLLDDVARVCIITFSDEAKVAVPLTRMSDYPSMPKFSYENQAHYGAAFRVLAAEMMKDYAGLRRAGCRVYRPCAYFLTSGEPIDHDWRDTFEETLTQWPMTRMGMPAYPIFVPFGFRNARAQILRRLAYPRGTSKWYHARGARIEDALDGLLGIIKNSVVRSGWSVLGVGPEHILPYPEPGSGISCHDAE